MKRRGARRRHVATAVVTLAIVGMIAILPGIASADPNVGTFYRANPPIWFTHRDATPWMYLLGGDGCLLSISWPAGTDFVVMHGFYATALDQNPIPLNPGLIDPTTMFQLYVDGTLMHSSVKVYVQSFPSDEGNVWWAMKFYEISFRGGMTGTHLFTGEWYNLGVPSLTCPVEVTFT